MGWFLNGKYYYSRFESEGFGWIGLILSITLVIAASGFFSISEFLRRKKEKAWILFFAGYIILALYSINCTTAGQYWDQQTINQASNTVLIDKENNSYWINRYEEKIRIADEELNNLKKIENNSIENMSDMYYYKNTGKTVQERKKEIKEEISNYESKLKTLTDQNKTSAKNQDNIMMSKSLYVFYRERLGKGEGFEQVVQFIFQLLLSIIIESIAQFAIFGYMKIKSILIVKETENKQIKPPVKVEKINKKEIHHFTLVAFSGIVKMTSKALQPKSFIIEKVKVMCPGFSEEKYSKIMIQAAKNKLVKIQRDNKWYPVNEFVTQDYFYKKMCEIFNFTLTGR